MTTIIYGDFHDALTGEMVTRELTAQEIAELPPQSMVSDVVADVVEETPVVDESVVE